MITKILGSKNSKTENQKELTFQIRFLLGVVVSVCRVEKMDFLVT